MITLADTIVLERKSRNIINYRIINMVTLMARLVELTSTDELEIWVAKIQKYLKKIL